MEHTIKYKHIGINWELKPQNSKEVICWLKNNFPYILEDKTDILKMDTGSIVAGKDSIVLKKRTTRTNKSTLLFAIRPSQSKKIYKITQELDKLGIPISQTLGHATEYKGFVRKADYLITRHITGITFRDILRGENTGISLENAVKKVAQLAGAFHRNNISNRDLKDSNLILNAETGQFIAVDYDGIVIKKKLTPSRVKKDLNAIFHAMKANRIEQKYFDLFQREYEKLT